MPIIPTIETMQPNLPMYRFWVLNTHLIRNQIMCISISQSLSSLLFIPFLYLPASYISYRLYSYLHISSAFIPRQNQPVIYLSITIHIDTSPKLVFSFIFLFQIWSSDLFWSKKKSTYFFSLLYKHVSIHLLYSIKVKSVNGDIDLFLKWIGCNRVQSFDLS